MPILDTQLGLYSECPDFPPEMTILPTSEFSAENGRSD